LKKRKRFRRCDGVGKEKEGENQGSLLAWDEGVCESRMCGRGTTMTSGKEPMGVGGKSRRRREEGILL